MADITGRVQKKAATLLDPGEAVLAALLVEPKGAYGLGSLAAAALPRTTRRKLSADAELAAAQAGGLAATFPTRSCVVAVTDRRIVAMPSNGVGMKEIAAAYAPGEVFVAENAAKGLGRRLRLGFADGTSVVVDAQRGQPFERFATETGQPL